MKSQFRSLSVLLFLVLLTSCAAEGLRRKNSVTLGMQRASVLAIMGEPDEIEQTPTCEALRYQYHSFTYDRPLCVFIQNGVVTGRTDYCTCSNAPPPDTHIFIGI